MTAVSLLRTLAAVAALTAVTFAHPVLTHAGTAPNRLDRNLGWVIAHGRIHNLFWDDNWDAHNPAFTEARINAFTADVGHSTYLKGAAQYGVGATTFASAHNPSPLCLNMHPPTTAHVSDLLAWITCEIVTPFTGVPYPSLGVPVSSDLYMVYLPKNTTLDGDVVVPALTVLGHTFGPFTVYHSSLGTSCTNFLAFHMPWTGATSPIEVGVVPARCAATLNDLTGPASHEIIESLTDPIPMAGWTDNSQMSISHPDGEAGDLCEHTATRSANVDGFIYATYWSNARGACVAG